MALPPPGTFRLYPFAEPPLPAGRYVLTGDVTGLPGPVEQMPTTIDVVSPRYALPPDQLLSAFPPAGARGSFTSRLPQAVLRRRTLPWERSPDLVPGGTPTPWLALVLIAEGEGRLLTDVPVEECVTAGVKLDPSDRDVPKGACLEVPLRVVTATFPTREDLAMLTHVREVDIRDTELAMGDDDGWMAVVLGNRLPQPDTRYLACLISLEGQFDTLPRPSDVQAELEYDRFVRVADLRAVSAETLGPAVTVDQAIMGLAGARPLDAGIPPGAGPGVRAAAAQAAVGPVARSASGAAAPTGSGWAATIKPQVSLDAANGPAAGTVAAASPGKLALADGFSFNPVLLLEPVFRFPALAYWSFTCTERGDFQYLAENVHARLLGHVADPDVPETPDGDPVPAGGAPPPGARPEPSSTRPLPLVAETGHVALPSVTRRGDSAEAWFRGPLAPAPVERAPPVRSDGTPRPPLAHHADQLRFVVPDGREDLGYAAAFEIGRLLALSQPGVAAALARWRHDAFGAAKARSTAASAVADTPARFAARALSSPDPLGPDTPERLVAANAGRRTVRAVFELLGEKPEAIAPSRPLADPGSAAADLRRAVGRRRDAVLAEGLGLGEALDGVDTRDAPAVARALAEAPARVAAERDPRADAALLRQTLEEEAGRLAEDVERAGQAVRFGPGGSR